MSRPVSEGCCEHAPKMSLWGPTKGSKHDDDDDDDDDDDRDDDDNDNSN